MPTDFDKLAQKLDSIVTKKDDETKSIVELFDDLDDRLREVETEKIPEINEKISSIKTTITVAGAVTGVAVGVVVLYARSLYSDLIDLLKVVYQHIGSTK